MGKSYYIRRCIDGGLESFSFVNFEGFRFRKPFKRFRVKKFRKEFSM